MEQPAEKSCTALTCLSYSTLSSAYNLMLIFASYYYAPWPWSCISILRMIRRILKAALHFKLYICLVAASYIIAVLPIYIIYSIVTIFKC